MISIAIVYAFNFIISTLIYIFSFLIILQQDISKRLSLPADVRLPESFLAKQSLSPTLDGPISRTLRRQSLVSDSVTLISLKKLQRIKHFFFFLLKVISSNLLRKKKSRKILYLLINLLLFVYSNKF